MMNAVDTDLPRRRSKVTRLCTRGGIKSTSEGDSPSLTNGAVAFFNSGLPDSSPFGGSIISTIRTSI